MQINIDLIYPIGSIYMSVLDTHPSTLFGGGWERIAQGRCLMGEGVVQPNTDNWCGEIEAGDWTAYSGLTGGEVFHKLTVGEIPNHNHAIYSGWGESSAGKDAYRYQYWGSNELGWKESDNLSTGYRGGGSSHNNLPPYLVVYMWKRVS